MKRIFGSRPSLRQGGRAHPISEDDDSVHMSSLSYTPSLVSAEESVILLPPGSWNSVPIRSSSSYQLPASGSAQKSVKSDSPTSVDEDEDIRYVLQLSLEQISALPRDMFPGCASEGQNWGGVLVKQGTISQYSCQGGSSACTTICLLAAEGLLMMDNLMHLSVQDIDGFVEQGAYIHQGLGMSHASVDDLWPLPPFSDITRSLAKGDVFQGSVTTSGIYLEAFQYALDFAVDSRRVAVVITKSGETVLCLTAKSSDGHHNEWYLFDSHGQGHENHKVVYLQQFDDLQGLIQGLQAKFPPQYFDGASLQGDMYNMFDAYPIVLSRKQPFSRSRLRSQSNEEWDMGTETVALMTAEEPALHPGEALRLSSSTPPLVPEHQKWWQLSDFQDPITQEVMADPVNCVDGQTYDRTSIEQWFDERIRAGRRAQNEQVDDDSAANCCGAARAPIELTSPLTGAVIADVLVPNLTLEQQIVRLVEANALDMTDEEIEEWRERRAEKRRRDEERREQERLERQRQGEMRRNAEEAESHWTDEEYDEAAQGETAPSRQVSIARDINTASQMIHENDTGLSVALAGIVHRVPVELLAPAGSSARCMVACCARVVGTEHRWCTRCARLVCEECLGFAVSDVADLQSSGCHLACIECVTQLVDVMEDGDLLMRQRRSLLLRRIERYMAELGNRASELQDCVIRHEAFDQFSDRLQETEDEITRLEQECSRLSTQLRRAEERAAEARADDGSGGLKGSDESSSNPSPNLRRIIELQEQRRALEKDYEELIESGAPDSADEQIEYAESVSALMHRLECTMTELAAAMSCSVETENESVSSEASGSEELQELEEQCEVLEGRLASLSVQDPNETEDASFTRVVEISTITVQLEELQMRLVAARSLNSVNQGRTSRQVPTKSPWAFDALARRPRPSLIEKFSRGFWRSLSTGSRRSSSPVNLGDLSSELDSEQSSVPPEITEDVLAEFLELSARNLSAGTTTHVEFYEKIPLRWNFGTNDVGRPPSKAKHVL